MGWALGTKTKATRPATYSFLGNVVVTDAARGRCVGQMVRVRQPQIVQVDVLSARGRAPR